MMHRSLFPRAVLLLLLVAPVASVLAAQQVVVMVPTSYYDPAPCASVQTISGLLYCAPQPTPTPVPTPIPTPTAVPVAAGQPCPASVHDRYMATGSDGIAYHTWHPLTDPSTGCIFDHEHGSNPALFDASGSSNPPYGEAAIHGGVDESSTAALHSGFKTYVIPDDGAGHTWMFSNHFGSNNARGGACNQDHEIQIAERDLNGAKHVFLKFVGNFGAGFDNTGATLYQCPPPGNPNTNNGHRLVPRGDLGQFAYEPWVPDFAGTTLNISSSLTFNTRNVQQTCGNQLCSEQIPTFNSGAVRFMQVGAGCGGCAQGPYPFTVYPAPGYFCTDPFGFNARAPQAGNICDGNGVLQFDDLTAPAVFPWYGENAKYACDVPDGAYTLRDFSAPECDMAPGLKTPN
jgi:hypothetical protein